MPIKVYDPTDGAELKFKFWQFSGGERGVELVSNKPSTVASSADVWLNFVDSNDILDLYQVVDILRNNGYTNLCLHMPYVPYARQDRRTTPFTAHSLRSFAAIINSFNFSSVYVEDPHSDVVEALINNVIIIPQHELLFNALIAARYNTSTNTVLVAPDAGAAKKIYSAATRLSSFGFIIDGVVVANKHRDPKSGKITHTSISDSDLELMYNKRVLVVDDICDGGRTFIELARVIGYAPTILDLYVTHGIFSQGKEDLLGYYDHIFTTNEFWSTNNA